VFQNVLTLENDRRRPKTRLAAIPDVETLKAEMADFILRHKEFPKALQEQIAERLYLERHRQGCGVCALHAARNNQGLGQSEERSALLRGPLGCVRRQPDLPMVYMATIEDSSESMVKLLVTKEGKLNPDRRHPAAGGRAAQS
jgi:hypothetical protein